MRKPVKIGVGGPVGSGKTALIERLCRALSPEFSIAVVTNDIYTKEDAEFLIRAGVLPEERIRGVETGGCPHTAIREDASLNQEAIRALVEEFPDLDILFVESGGDNLAASFSPGARGLLDVRHRRIGRGQDPPEGRPRGHPIEPPHHQQGGSRPHGRRRSRRNGKGRRPDAEGETLGLYQSQERRGPRDGRPVDKGGRSFP